MPYADVERQREYGRLWIAERRRAWFAENGPCVDCGTWEELQLDHVDPGQKVEHRVWSWSEARRLVELAKCVARCKLCHRKKTRMGREDVNRSGAKLSVDQVAEVRRLLGEGGSQAGIAREMGVQRTTIYRIAHDLAWA